MLSIIKGDLIKLAEEGKFNVIIVQSHAPKDGFVTPGLPSRYGFPQIGAGHAGGDWSRISKMIEQFSGDVKPCAEVTIVQYQP